MKNKILNVYMMILCFGLACWLGFVAVKAIKSQEAFWSWSKRPSWYAKPYTRANNPLEYWLVTGFYGAGALYLTIYGIKVIGKKDEV